MTFIRLPDSGNVSEAVKKSKKLFNRSKSFMTKCGSSEQQ